MEIENTNYQNPQEYINKLNELNGSIDLLLGDFSKIYVSYKMNSTTTEYQHNMQILFLILTKYNQNYLVHQMVFK